MKSPRVAITMGDPAGVGPELCAALLHRGRRAVEGITFYADGQILAAAYESATGEALPEWAPIEDRAVLAAGDIVAGTPCAKGAAAQVAYLESAANAALAGQVDAIVTAPVNKEQCRRAGLETPGQTEFFASRLGARRVAMMFAGPRCRVVLCTIHVALADVAKQCTKERITAIGELATTALHRDFAVPNPRIGVLGLNPHAGEGGLIGREELDVISPAIAELNRQHSDATFVGPLPPDTAFYSLASGRTHYDLLICMYHDQALGPLKLLDFDGSVNVTLGLPVVRTSPDHGVAYDIAGQGVANPRPFFAALDRAMEITKARRAFDRGEPG